MGDWVFNVAIAIVVITVAIALTLVPQAMIDRHNETVACEKAGGVMTSKGWTCIKRDSIIDVRNK